LTVWQQVEPPNEAPNGEPRLPSRSADFTKAAAFDLAFTVWVVVLMVVGGFAFESVLLSALLAIFGGLMSWIMWRKFRHRTLGKGHDAR